MNYETAGPVQAYAAGRQEAKRPGVEIAGTEIVGLVPEAALDTSAEYLSIGELRRGTVVEHRLQARAQSTTAKER